MSRHLTLLAALAVLAFTSSTHADPSATKPAPDCDCDAGLAARSFLLQGAAPAAGEQPQSRIEVRKEKTTGEAPAKVAGRVVVLGPDGKRQEFSFGNPSGKDLRKRVKHGGAHLELMVAPNRESLERLKEELEQTFENHGIGEKLAGQVVEALKDLDDLAAVQIRGLAVGPDQLREEFALRFGEDVPATPRQFDKEMEDGGAQLELGVETTEQTNDILGMLLHAPESLELLEESLRNPETIKLLNEIVSNPELMEFFQSAAQDPELLGALRKGLEDPLLSGLLSKGLNNEGAANLLKLFGGAAEPAPEAAEDAPADDPGKSLPPQKKAKRDAEIDELREELADQRALLEEILRKLDQ